MRKLMWISIGFSAACAIGFYLLHGAWLLAPLGLCLIGFIVSFFIRNDAVRKVQAVLLGCILGIGWYLGYDALYLRTARNYDGMTVHSTVTATDYSFDNSYGIACEGNLELDGKTYRVRCYTYAETELRPGDRIEADFRLRYTADGGEQTPTYHAGRGIFLIAYADQDAQIIPTEKIPAKYFAPNLRRQITDRIDLLFSEDAAAFARALLLGDSSKLSYETDTAFKVSGIRHIIAVSGMHISILFSLIYLVSAKRRYLTAIIGIPTLLLFAAIAGFTPSVVRACVLQGLVMLAMVFDKEYDPPTALGFSVLLMLAVNPMAVSSVSLQLSVGCMIGIFLFAEKIRTYLVKAKIFGKYDPKSRKGRYISRVCGGLSVSLAAMSFTTPLSIAYFGMVSVVGILTNLLTLWMVSAAFYGVMAACAVSVICIPLGKAAAFVTGLILRLIAAIAQLLSKPSFAAVYSCSSYILFWVISVYILLAVFLLSRRKHPLVLTGCIAGLLICAVCFSQIEPRLDDFRVEILDVGQGQCILLHNGDKHFMVDCGGDYADSAADTAAQQLLSEGITRLDGVIVTHYDEDHAGGVTNLLSRIPADILYLPEKGSADEEELTAIPSQEIRLLPPLSQTKVGGTLTLFAASTGNTANESSVCVLFQPENCDILITGDRTMAGEHELLTQTDLPKLELLIVGHHGSETSTGMELLNAARPYAAAISVGKNNRYGHPAQETIERLTLFGCRILRTDHDGTILIRG